MKLEVMPERVLELLALILVGIPLAFFTPVFLALAIMVFAPAVDDVVGGVSQNALSVVQNHKEGTASIKELVARHYRDPHWRAFHRDYLEETYVRCDASTNAGQPIGLVWVVISEPRMHGLLPTLQVTTTAHNRAAYELAPSLYQQGHILYGSPDIANW
jgi:hypothetical protein